LRGNEATNLIEGILKYRKNILPLILSVFDYLLAGLFQFLDFVIEFEYKC